MDDHILNGKSKLNIKLSLIILRGVTGNIIRRIDDLSDFRDLIFAAIEDEKIKVERRLRRKSKKLSKNEVEQLNKILSEEKFLLDDTFQNIALNSIVVILYGYIEYALNTICDSEYLNKNLASVLLGKTYPTVHYTKTKDKGIRRAKVYLEEVVGCSLNTDKKPWSEIVSLQKIRNTIIHNDSDATKEITGDSNIKKHISEGALKLSPERGGQPGKVIIKAKYIDYVLPVVKDFFISVRQKTKTAPVLKVVK